MEEKDSTKTLLESLNQKLVTTKRKIETIERKLVLKIKSAKILNHRFCHSLIPSCSQRLAFLSRIISDLRI